MPLLRILGLIALVLAWAHPAAAQDHSLQITLTLSRHAVTSTQSKSLGLRIEFRNRLPVPLRWHPVYDPFRTPCVVYLRRSDGRRYLASGMWEPMYVCPTGGERTDVLAAGGSWTTLQVLGLVFEPESRGWMSRYAYLRREDGRKHSTKPYMGPLPAGDYQVWVRFYEGPPLNPEDFHVERTPAEGEYTSNRVRLTVRPDRYRQETPGPNGVLTMERYLYYYETPMIAASALAPFGIEAKRRGRRLVLRRDSSELPFRHFALHRSRPNKMSDLPRAIRFPDGEDYVPLEETARHFGLRSEFGLHPAGFRLRQAPEAGHPSPAPAFVAPE